MNAPNPSSSWDSSAPQPLEWRFVLAATRAVGQVFSKGPLRAWQRPHHSDHSDLSPIMPSGPSEAGLRSFRNRQANADSVTYPKYSFESLRFAIESCAIKTPTRGSQTCKNRSFSLLFSPFRCPPACRTQHRVVWRAPLQVPLSPMRWMKTWLQARRLAALLVRPLAASNWAYRPVSRATDLTPACGQALLDQGVAWAMGSGGPVSFAAPMRRTTEGEPCSRKS